MPEWGPTRLPDAARDPWFDTLRDPVTATAALHFCMPHQVVPLAGALNLNYSMFEATRIPRSWVAHNLRHDLVVVPTESSRRAWIATGFPDDRITLCPLGVDPTRFRPDAEPLALTNPRGRPLHDYRVRVLNVSEPSPRKNLAALLRVWIRATTTGDDAILIVKLARYSAARTVKFLRDLDAAERAVGKARGDAAPMLFYDQVLGDAEMPGLFAGATHYWSMSHGEGWDQPMMQAAATGLRLIAPAHSSYPAYLDDSVATMIPTRTVPAEVDGDEGLARIYGGAEWWEPDEEAAAAAIHAAVRGGEARRPTARERIAAGFTWDHATDRLVAILADVHQRHGRPFDETAARL